MLWIAFRIVFLLMIPNCFWMVVFCNFVVNCFQNCIFTYDSQHRMGKCVEESSCELLSELYFYLWFPTIKEGLMLLILLWIAFRIVFLLMIPNKNCPPVLSRLVVNCFQNCIFTYDSQHTDNSFNYSVCCELLSELYFYLWFPTHLFFWQWYHVLWIAFRIVFLLMIPNISSRSQP